MFPGLETRAKLPGLLLGVANTWSALQTFTSGIVANAVSLFNKAVRGNVQALTSTAGSIAINADSANYFSHTFTENTTLANPTNLTAGQTIVIAFTQHASSPKTLAFGSYWDFGSGTVPTVTATNSAVDVLVGYVVSSTKIAGTMINNVS